MSRGRGERVKALVACALQSVQFVIMPSRDTQTNGSPVHDATALPSTRREELRSFLFFTVVLAPALAVLLVASYGFVVWMVQLVAGPPAS